MVYVETLSQPSIFELARSGNFQAISYWINSLLRPEGIEARVEAANAGCLQILIEFQRELAADTWVVGVLRERLVRFICHHLWKLNSPAVEGVRVVARAAGTPDILWKQSVRIVTPANRSRRRAHYSLALDWVKFKTFRSLLMVGSAIASFVLGCWVSYHEALALRPMSVASQSALVRPAIAPTRPDTVQAALEAVPVFQHTQVANPNDPTVTLMFAGDVTLSDWFADTMGNDYTRAFAKLDEYREADLAMVNLENPLTDSGRPRPGKQFNFKAAPEAIQVLTAGGVDIVNLANNHTMDYEEPGLVETLETLDKVGIRHLGAGRDIKEARRPEIIEVKGQRIAYLGYYDSDLHAAGDGIAGTNPRRNDRIAEDIRALRNQVDWIIVNFHWGLELADYPGDWQIDLARFTIDQGADLVVGHHPHVLQGAEIYKDRPIIYSLGNFIFGGNSRKNYDTAVLNVALNGRKMKVEFLPVEVRDYQPQVVKGEKAQSILKPIEQLSSIFDRPMQSAVVLEAPAPERQDPIVSPNLVAPPSDRPEPQPFTPKPAPTLPNLPKDSDKTTGLSEQESAPTIESSPPPGNELPPRLYLNPPEHPRRESDPFIKEPFIKDPFISPASPNGTGPDSQSSLHPVFSPSFQLVPKASVHTASAASPHPKSLLLPQLENGHREWVTTNG